MAGASRGNPVESIHYYRQAGRFYLVDSTAFMDVGCTLLYSEIPPSLVTGSRAICVNISDIVISFASGFFVVVLFYQELDLCVSIACLPLLTFPSFPTVTGVSLQADVEIGLSTFPIAWFVVSLREKRKTKQNKTNQQTNKQTRTPLFHPP